MNCQMLIILAKHAALNPFVAFLYVGPFDGFPCDIVGVRNLDRVVGRVVYGRIECSPVYILCCGGKLPPHVIWKVLVGQVSHCDSRYFTAKLSAKEVESGSLYIKK